MDKLILILLLELCVFFTASWGQGRLSYDNHRTLLDRRLKTTKAPVITSTLKPTACRIHQSSPNKTGVMLGVQCTDSGDYKPLQCTVPSAEKCACYNKKKGPISHLSAQIETCTCIKARRKAKKRGVKKCDIPGCELSGNFRPKTCCLRSGGRYVQCVCRNRTSGERTAIGDAALICSSTGAPVLRPVVLTAIPEIRSLPTRRPKPRSTTPSTLTTTPWVVSFPT